MAQLSTMNQIFDILSKKDGIIGIHARPGLGKTTLMLQIVDEVNKRKDGTALIFSMAESQAQLIHRMQQMNISCDRVVIDDTSHPTAEYMQTRIKQARNVSILCIDYLQLLEQAVAEKLIEISEKYGIPIVVNGILPRGFENYGQTGDPEQCSVLEQIAQQKYFLIYDFLALIRRDQGCVGAEFLVKKCWHWEPVDVIMEWDTKETKFEFGITTRKAEVITYDAAIHPL